MGTKLLLVTMLLLVSTSFILQSLAVDSNKNSAARLAQLKRLFKFASLLTKLSTIMKHLKVKSNHSKRTFTIRFKDSGKTVTKYRTVKFSVDEFSELEYNTQNDWIEFLIYNTNDYYTA